MEPHESGKEAPDADKARAHERHEPPAAVQPKKASPLAAAEEEGPKAPNGFRWGNEFCR